MRSLQIFMLRGGETSSWVDNTKIGSVLSFRAKRGISYVIKIQYDEIPRFARNDNIFSCFMGKEGSWADNTKIVGNAFIRSDHI